MSYPLECEKKNESTENKNTAQNKNTKICGALSSHECARLKVFCCCCYFGKVMALCAMC